MANNGNLQSFEKGQSGNPNGRPKGSRNVSTVLARMLDEIAPDIVIEKSYLRQIAKNIRKPTYADAAAARLLHEAVVEGEAWALREMLDRTEGKAKQSIEIRRQNDSTAIVAVLQRWITNSSPSQSEIDEKLVLVADANRLDIKELTESLGLNEADR